MEAPSRLLDDQMRALGAAGVISRRAGPEALLRLFADPDPDGDSGDAAGASSSAVRVTLDPEAALELSGRGSGPIPTEAIDRARTAVDGFRSAVRSAALELPGRGDVLPRLQSLLASPEAGVEEIVGVIESDPAIVTGVLRASNVAAGTFATAALSVEDACVRLGNRVALAIAQQAAIRSILVLNNEPWVSLGDAWWAHAEAVSQVARKLAPGIGAAPQDGFLAGLLANVGEIAILAAAERWDDGGSATADGLLVAVREVMPAEHGRVGAVILEGWGYPQRWTKLARDHHGGLGVRRTPVQQLAALAHLLVLEADLTYVAPGPPGDASALATAVRIDLDEARAEAAAIAEAVTAA